MGDPCVVTEDMSRCSGDKGETDTVSEPIGAQVLAESQSRELIA